MTDEERPEPSLKTADPGQHADTARLSVTLPRDTLMQLKIHAAQHQATMRDVVAGLIQNELRRNPL
ncbi:hypothetical protein [Hoeflea sp. BAL378]|uniref:hypothetical protein n=1 Tax=Hoeflea sp. BAL378 TaxID=1547437 RepID=UPI0005573E9F|nr:hypothetical protein [Hoeflea sp. BAL378]